MINDPELYSSCCFCSVRDDAGEGVGGLDICPECGEWCTIITYEDENEEETEKEKT